DDFSAEIINSTPAAHVIAGIDKSIGSIMCRKLYRSEPQTIECPQQVDVTIHVPGTLEIQESRHFTFFVDTLNIRSIECQLNHGIVFLDLIQCEVHHTEGILYFKPSRIVMFRRIDREEHGIQATFPCTGQVDIPIGITLTDIS